MGINILSDVTIFDTDKLIDASLGVFDALSCLEYHENRSRLAVSIITKMELIVGCRNKKELHDTQKFLQQFEIININEAISRKADDLLTAYRLSHGLLIADALIAATAISWNYQLISKNQRDYRFIDELNLLSYP